jgi:hypothetical protein
MDLQDSFVVSPTLEAMLTRANLPTLLQMFSDDQKSCTLEVRKAGRMGRIHLKGGRLIHAELGGVSGDAAFLLMAQWLEADLVMVLPLCSEMHSTQLSLQNLLMEAMRIKDEAKGDPAQPLPAQPELGAEEMITALLKRPESHALMILQYSTGTMLACSEKSYYFSTAHIQLYQELLNNARRLGVVSGSAAVQELSLVLGEHHHLLYVAPSKALCVIHVGQRTSSHQGLLSSLKQIACKVTV